MRVVGEFVAQVPFPANRVMMNVIEFLIKEFECINWFSIKRRLKNLM